MLSKGPHISIQAESLVPRILHIPQKEFANWPIAVRKLTLDIAAELFLVRYNPFIAADIVKKSVNDRFNATKQGLDHHFVTSLDEGITMFWSTHEQDMLFRHEIIARLKPLIAPQSIDTSNYCLVDNATDSTDLRLELPLLVLTPATIAEVIAIVTLAGEMQFALVPRGGGSGATGGAIPARKRSVVLSLTKLNQAPHIDATQKLLTAQAGVITNDAIIAAAAHNLLFSVDPASRTASSIGGNIAENAGGPLCFEYGTTIDNLVSYRMVTPKGALVTIKRKNHPRKAIGPEDTAIFEVHDDAENLLETIILPSAVIRTPGLGKDVTNKALGGLPGVQKEGTDGVIVDASFVLHDKLAEFKVVVLEFFGRSMENCMLVVNEIVALRDDIRTRGDLVKITALEEFNAKYVRAIEYSKKSTLYEGDPISVLILQLDSNDTNALTEAVNSLVQICNNYDGVDSFVAKDTKEADLFWEDRHKLSMIARHTSGFKINEDVVIPMRAIPEYARYLESLNLEYTARAYRTALRSFTNLPAHTVEDLTIAQEVNYATSIIKGEISAVDISDDELNLHAALFLRSLHKTYPTLAKDLTTIERHMQATRISVASHMHAGDGNWHVNIPVNSNDPVMLGNAEKVAHLVMGKAQELGGEVTGEHGIGITKIAFLTDAKIKDFTTYKQKVDPSNIFNPAKLTQKELPVAPFTFSFNRLIEDIEQSGLPDKRRLISLLTNIQACTRCGKCKQFCPMHTPEASLMYHPRNKNLILGALIEAIYYSQVSSGKIDPFLLTELQQLMEFCTNCGKCMSVCPVKIASHEVALTLRSFLEDERAGGHPIKSKILSFIAKKPDSRIPLAGKAAAFGQRAQNNFLTLLPHALTKKLNNPLFSGKGPEPDYINLGMSLHLERGSCFIPQGEIKGSVLYFPGCGGAIFSRHIGVAGVALLLQSGFVVVLPKQHLCCGYPLLAAGAHDDFATNQDRNIKHLRTLAEETAHKGYPIQHVLTACGSCRDGMERHFIPDVFPTVAEKRVVLSDVAWFLMQQNATPAHFGLPENSLKPITQLLYHAPCHAEVPGMHKAKASGIYMKQLQQFFNLPITLTPGCCAESGMGALTTPLLYNKLRAKKSAGLEVTLQALPENTPIVVACPSCKIGIERILLGQKRKRRVVHVLELMAEHIFGNSWRRKITKYISAGTSTNGFRHVPLGLNGKRNEKASEETNRQTYVTDRDTTETPQKMQDGVLLDTPAPPSSS